MTAVSHTREAALELAARLNPDTAETLVASAKTIEEYMLGRHGATKLVLNGTINCRPVKDGETGTMIGLEFDTPPFRLPPLDGYGPATNE